MSKRLDNSHSISAPRGRDLSAKSWLTEAPPRMLMNNLDADVAEKPHELVVYGGIGRAARDWESFDRIAASLRELEADETLLVQSGKPVGVFRTHRDASRVLIANSNLVPHWASTHATVRLERPPDCGQQRSPMSGCRILMKLTAAHEPPGDVGRLQLGAFRRRMGSEIAGDSDEDMPTLLGIAPRAEL